MGVRRGQAFHWNLSGGLGNPNSEGFGEGDVEVDDRGDGWSSKGILVICNTKNIHMKNVLTLSI